MLDSAGKYGAGMALEVIGRELAAAGVSPSDVIISNKLAWRRTELVSDEPTFEPGVWKDIGYDAVEDISAEGIQRCWDEGNKMLGNYPASLVAIHDPDEFLMAATDSNDRDARLAKIIDACEQLFELRKQGKVQGVGIGCKDWRIVRELAEHVQFDWIMIANSLTVMNHPADLLQMLTNLHQSGIQIINSAILHGGFLSGGDFFDYRPIDSSDVADRKRLSWRSDFHRLCQQYDVSWFQAAVSFASAHDSISSVALSSSNPARTPSMRAAVDASLPSPFWLALADAKLIDNDSSITQTLIG